MIIPGRITAAVFVLALWASGLGTSRAEEPLLAGRLGTNVAPVAYDLDLVIQPERDRFRGTTRITIDIAEPTRKIWLHGMDLDVDGIVLVQDRSEEHTSELQSLMRI